jgi:hypothetical protein
MLNNSGFKLIKNYLEENFPNRRTLAMHIKIKIHGSFYRILEMAFIISSILALWKHLFDNPTNILYYERKKKRSIKYLWSIFAYQNLIFELNSLGTREKFIGKTML